jgi:hypothetical protein
MFLSRNRSLLIEMPGQYVAAELSRSMWLSTLILSSHHDVNSHVAFMNGAPCWIGYG